ncbi:MAG: mechanosensitive ion channel, partial [Candidatus Amulumruptor sp.]|nr:mechanosensitive ion channel [Candidatus Amulumruptor sp.]
MADLLSKLAHDSVDLVIHLAIAILVFYAGRFIITRLTRLIASVMVRRRIDLSLSTFLISMVRIVLYFILIITVIGILGINTSSFLALFASAGVAIGMALSGTLQNFAGGVLILLLKPYRIGDYIEAQGYSGTVKEIQIFHTIINTPDNKSIIIPNGGLSTGTINNWSRAATRRVSWDVSIAYGDSVDAAREKILSMLASDDRVIHGEKNSIVKPLLEAGALPPPELSPSVG